MADNQETMKEAGGPIPQPPMGLTPVGEGEVDLVKNTNLSATATPFYCMKPMGQAVPETEIEEDLTLTQASAPKVSATKLMKRAKRPIEGEIPSPSSPPPPAVTGSAESTPTTASPIVIQSPSTGGPSSSEVGRFDGLVGGEKTAVEDAYDRARDKILGPSQEGTSAGDGDNTQKKRKVQYRGIVSEAEMGAYSRGEEPSWGGRGGGGGYSGNRRGGFEGQQPSNGGRGRGSAAVSAQYDADYSRSSYQHDAAANGNYYQNGPQDFSNTNNIGGQFINQNGRGRGGPMSPQPGGDNNYPVGQPYQPSRFGGRGRGGNEGFQPDGMHQPNQYSHSTRGGIEVNQRTSRGGAPRGGHDTDYQRGGYQGQHQQQGYAGSHSLFPAPGPSVTVGVANNNYSGPNGVGPVRPNPMVKNQDGVDFYSGPPPNWSSISGGNTVHGHDAGQGYNDRNHQPNYQQQQQGNGYQQQPHTDHGANGYSSQPGASVERSQPTAYW